MPRRTERPATPRMTTDGDMVALAQVYNRRFSLIVSKDEEEGILPMVTVMMPRAHSNGFALSSMTGAELRAVKAVFDLAFALAEPVVQALDEKAEQAWERGDDSFRRIYRAAPVFALRERVLTSHYEGVPGGPEGVADVVEDVRRRTADLGRFGTSSSRVLLAPQDDVEPSDEPATGDGGEGVG